MLMLTIVLVTFIRPTNHGITDMNLGILAFGFSVVCLAVSLLGAAEAEPERKPAADYKKIYQAIEPKEI